MERRYVLKAALAAYILFVFALALVLFPLANPAPNLVPFRSIIRAWQIGGWPFVVDFVGNIVAFIPMGLVPPFIRRRPTRVWQVAIFGLLLSAAIESGQFISGRRVPDVDDVILNTAGTILGYCCAAISLRYNSPRRTVAASGPLR
jgi:glycopeptide antibiotics resistance protein